jgi:hypothetical protein
MLALILMAVMLIQGLQIIVHLPVHCLNLLLQFGLRVDTAFAGIAMEKLPSIATVSAPNGSSSLHNRVKLRQVS